MLRYENHTTTALELVRGDIRDAPESFIVMGRDPDLKAHFERRTGNPFTELSSWLRDFPVQLSRASDGGLTILRTHVRPSGSSRHRHKQISRLQTAIEIPLAHTLCDAKQIAMIPLSCRAHNVVASAMIRIIWDISVAAFLNVTGPLSNAKPSRFTIYCNSDLQPLIDVLESGHYASLNHGWLFNTEVQCDRAKRARYFARRRFKYRRTSDGSCT
jgi:hypothetical protein